MQAPSACARFTGDGARERKRGTTMKKRLLSILLIGCMLLMLLPTAVFAEDAATAVMEVATTDALTAALADDTVAAIQLTSDINISATLTIRRTVTLDLNGHVLKMTGSTFTLAGGSIVGCTASSGGGVFVNSSGASTTKTVKFTFTSGSIRDCSADDNSRPVL